MSLYLKYRPATFTDLIGQRHIIDILIAQAKSDQLAHSYLLYGPRGTGKTSTARLLAKIVNCTTFTADGQPDLVNDPACQLIDENKTLDFVEIDAASHTGVDNIRDEIIDKALYPPAHLKKKVYVIDEVHMLSKGAFNALLKTMEEPPPYLLFILATTELHKVPDTIISRCQVFNFKQLTLDEITGRLQHIATAEHIAYEESALRLIAKLSSGAMRDAIKYLEQISILGEVTEEHVAQFLGATSDRLLEEAMHLLQGDDPHAWIVFLDMLVTQGVDLQNFAKEILLRLDVHFLENPKQYAYLAGMIREIIAETKRYPHPLLVRKAKTWIWFVPDTTPTHHTPPRTKSESINQTPPQPITEKPKEAPKKIETAEGIISGALETHQEISKDLGGQSPQEATPLDTKSHDLPSGRVLSPELIIETLVKGTKNPMLKATLKQNVLIQEITDTTIGAIVINEQFYHTISRAEISHELEHTLRNELQYTGHLKRTYMTKEDRLLQQMSEGKN